MTRNQNTFSSLLSLPSLPSSQTKHIFFCFCLELFSFSPFRAPMPQHRLTPYVGVSFFSIFFIVDLLLFTFRRYRLAERFRSMFRVSQRTWFTDTLFLGFCLQMGRNHRFSYPPFFYFFAVSLRPLCRPSAKHYLCIGVISVCFLKVSNIFCSFLSFVPLL